MGMCLHSPLFSFFVVPGMEPMASCMLGRSLPPSSLPSPNMSVRYLQAKETNSKQKEFEETAAKVRQAMEQLAALE